MAAPMRVVEPIARMDPFRVRSRLFFLICVFVAIQQRSAVENLLHPIVQEEIREQLHRGNILGIENLRWVKDGSLADLLIGGGTPRS